MKRFVFEVTDEYAKKLNDQKVIELCFRDSIKHFEEFIKVKPLEDDEVKKVIEEATRKVLKANNKVEKNIKQVKDKLNVLDKNIDNFVNNMNLFSDKSNKILKSLNNSEELGWANVIISSLDLCATTIGFTIMSGKIDEMIKELGEIGKATKDLVDHQELLDCERVKSLTNEYANIQNKESLMIPVSVDDYYNIVDKMSLMIDTLRECFIRDIGHRKVYLNAISILLPVYTLSLCKFDKAHYFEYGKTHSNRDNYIKVFDDFVDMDFFVGLQEHCFFNETQKLNVRQSYEVAFAYVEKINEQRALISNQLTIINKFDDKDVYEEFVRRMDEATKEDILEEIKENCTSEIYEQVQVILESN